MQFFLKASPLLILLTIFLIYFQKLIFGGEIYVTGDFLRSDILHNHLPLKFTLHENLHNFSLPFWSREIAQGFPLFAEGQMGTFSPTVLVPFLLFPFTQAYNFSLILNFIIAAFGMFFLAKSFKLNSSSALFCAVAFSLSSFFVLRMVHQSIINPASWVPLYFLFLKNYFETKQFKFLLLSSLILTFQIFGGYAQISFYTIFCAFIFFLFLNFKKEDLKKFFLSYTSIVIIAILLSSVQLLPTFELTQESTRNQGIGNAALDSLPFHPRNLITFVNPFAFGDPGKGTYPHFGENWGMFWENTVYFGLLPLVFALLTLLFLKKNKIVFSFWVLVIFSLLLTLGKYGPLMWVFELPVFNYFRVTARFLLFVIFSLTLLSGFGLQSIMEKLKKHRLSFPFAIGAVLVLVIDLFGFSFKYNPTAKAATVLETPKILEQIKLNPGEKIFSVAPFITYDQINKNGWRENTKQNLNHKNALDPNINLLWNIPNFEGYTGLFLGNNELLRNKIYAGIKVENEKVLSISETSINLLKTSSVKYLISAFDLQGKDLQKVSEAGEAVKYKLYELKNFSPLGILEEGESKLLEYYPTKVVLELNSAKDQQLILQNNFYPGWKAFVNEVQTPIYLSSETFQSINVPKGESIVRFTYSPNSFYVGAIISFVAFSFSALLLIQRKRKT